MSGLLLPFAYDYMIKAMWVSGLVGATCAFLSAYLMLKGWSLMGDALAHSIVPGVAGAYLLGIPFAAGAFITGFLAAIGMWFVRQQSKLREDAVIGIVFTSFFAAGLLLVSINPTAVNVQSIVLGNILGISDADAAQVVAIAVISLAVLAVKWKDLMVVFFDETHARLRALCEALDIQWLERETRVIDGVRFVGTTLWADFDALAAPHDPLGEVLKKRAKAFRAADFYLEKAEMRRNGAPC